MKNRILTFVSVTTAYLLIGSVTPPPGAWAAGTMLHGVREGLHDGFSRLVFDCEGAPPDAVGPARDDAVLIRFADLTVDADLDEISGKLEGNIQRVELQEEMSAKNLRLLLKDPGMQVKSFILESDPPQANAYRVVVDVSAPAEADTGGKSAPASAAAALPAGPATEIAAALPAGTASETDTAVPAPDRTARPEAAEAPERAPEKTVPQSRAAADAAGAADGKSPWNFSADAGLLLRSVTGDRQSSWFETYRDISQPVSGGFRIEADKDHRLFLNGFGSGIGGQTPSAGVDAGRYGMLEATLAYDRFIRRYGYNARTLYSGVGGGILTLDDGLQSILEGETDSVARAALLSGFVAGYSAAGDPTAIRNRLKLGVDIAAFKPFDVTLRLSRETRTGTRPFAGAFNNLEMVELFEPIDYETTNLDISGEYARNNLLLSADYRWSRFTNNIDTLTFDNPLRLTDAVFGPGTGRFDLAPDNQYHNLAVSGALGGLPLRSRITGSAAFGLMLQDDSLIPLTSNTAFAPAALPQDSPDARVETTRLGMRFTSRPFSFMQMNANLKHDKYINRTGQIIFPDGYVETDEFVTGTPISNLPTSYAKTRAGIGLDFNLLQHSNLGLGYSSVYTERRNRQVEDEKTRGFNVSLDNRALDWADFHASYEHLTRRIGDYRYDVYLASGDNLEELPQMRKYDQADRVRDHYRVRATVYPTPRLALTGSFSRGRDDYDKSLYGLLEDEHFFATFDVDYAAGDRLSMNLFYSYEKYKNRQRGSENGQDWTAAGEDLGNTGGGNLALVLLPDRLDLDIAYTYSEADGSVSFTGASETFAGFNAVDDSRRHELNTKLKYYFSNYLDLSFGYLWGKFNYDDYGTDGFEYVPVNAGGGYQGALLSGTLPADYNAHIIYTQLIFHYN